MENQHPDKGERLPGKSRALMHSLSNYSDKTRPRAGNSLPWNNKERGFGAFLWIFTAPSPCGLWDLPRALHRKETTSKKISPTSSGRSQKCPTSRTGKKGTKTEGIVRIPLEFHLQSRHLPQFSVVFLCESHPRGLISSSWMMLKAFPWTDGFNLGSRVLLIQGE